MANEAILMIETELPIPMTVSNTVGIEKGALLTLSDPLTAAKATAAGAMVAGIASDEKIANDGMIKNGVYRRGIFKVLASGTINVGEPVGFDGGQGGNNYVYSVNEVAALSGARVAGIALETAADEETFLMELNIQSIPDVSQ